MKIFKRFFGLALRNAGAHWAYMFSGGFGIVAAFIGLTLFRLYIFDAKNAIRSVFQERMMMGDFLIVNSKEAKTAPIDLRRSRFSQTEVGEIFSSLKSFKNPPSFEMRVLYGAGMISTESYETPFMGRGVDLAAGVRLRGEKWQWDTIAGPPLHLSQGRNSIAIGRGLADLLNCKVDQRNSREITGDGFIARERPFICSQAEATVQLPAADGRMNKSTAQITSIVDGIFQDLDSVMLATSLETMQMFLETTDISYFAVKAPDGVILENYIEEISKLLVGNKIDATAIKWSDSKEGDLFNRACTILDSYYYLVGIMLSLLTCASLYYGFRKMTAERAKEWAILQSLGFSRNNVAILIFLEATIIVALSMLIAVGSSIALSKWINSLDIWYQVGGLSYDIPFRIGFSQLIFIENSIFFLSIAACSVILAAWMTLRSPFVEGFQN